MELERLELVFDFNLERVEAMAKKLQPQIDKIMGQAEGRSAKGAEQIERNFSLEKVFEKLTKQFERMNANFEKQTKQLETMAGDASKRVSEQLGEIEKKVQSVESVSGKSAVRIGQNVTNGLKKARMQSGKEIDAIVKDIDAKMNQARAAQEKSAMLRAQQKNVNHRQDPQSAIQYEEQIARAESATARFHSSAQKLANDLRNEFKMIPHEMNVITQSMQENEGQIERVRSRIKQLQVEYQSQLGSRGSFQTGFTYDVENKQSLETQTQIDKQTIAMNKAIQKNDQLAQTYAHLEDRLRQVTPAVANLNTELGNPRSYSIATNGMNRFRDLLGRVSNRAKDFFGQFSRGTRNVSKNTRGMLGPLGTVDKYLRRFARRFFVLVLAYRAFSGTMTYMGRAVMVNEQFSASLNEIRVNLATAFYPIYQAVMPALNALIGWLATATAYLAQFIATIFGTTYSAAKKGASSLNEQIANMDDTGAAADRNAQRVKKFQASLMGFDEINTLSMGDDETPEVPTTSGLPNGIDFNIPEPQTPAWMEGFAKRVQDIMSRLFDPMKKSWDTHGQTVMNAWKHALDETWGLTKSIGRDFLNIWENGTGERTMGNILLLTAEVGWWIGDIARASRIAWDEFGRGEAFIQSMFDSLNEIMELVLSFSGSWRDVWNDGTGVQIMGNLLEIGTNFFNTIANLAGGFREAWEEADTGVGIASNVLGFVNDILSRINEMAFATSQWADNLNFSPILQSINGLFGSMRPTIQFISDLLSGMYRNILLPIGKWTIEKALPASIDVLSGAFELLNSIFQALKPLGEWLFNNFLTPLANWTGDAFVWILEKIGDGLRGIGDFISKHQAGFSNFVLVFGTFAGTLKLISGLTTLGKILSTAFAGLSSVGGLSGLISGVGTAIGGVITTLGGPWALAIAGAVGAGVLLWRNWDTVKEKASKLGSWIGDKWDGIKSATSTAWNKVKDFMSGNSSKASKDVMKNYENMEVNSSSVFGDMSGVVNRLFPNMAKTITDKSKEAWTNTKDSFGNMKNNAASRFKEISDSSRDRFKDVWSNISNRSSTAKDQASNAFRTMKDNARSRFEEVSTSARDRFRDVWNNISERSNNAKNTATTAFRTMKDSVTGFMNTIRTTTNNAFNAVAGWASGLGSRIASGLRSGLDAIRNVTRSIGNTLVNIPGRAVNGVLGGVRWVLNAVGAKTMANNLKNYTIPTYMHGTSYHPGGLAMVNDAPGAFWQEAYQLPTGKIGLFPEERNLMVDLPRGSKVLNGQDTHTMIHMDGIPRYAKGIGNFFSNAWNGAKKMAGTVWDYMSNPSKLLEVAISKFVNLTNAMQPQLDMAKGAISTASRGAVDFIKNQMEKNQLTGTAKGGGVNFKGLVQTSPFGYRIHPIFGTRRLHAGVDFAGGQGIGHPIHAQASGIVTASGPSGTGFGTFVKIRQGIMEYIYAHLSRAIAKVGAQAQRGQLIGLMGNTGDSTGPHVHYEVRRGGTPINPMSTIGYENGGLVRSEQVIRIAERNKPEMVLPLTRPSRALALMGEALDFMGLDFSALSMPEVFDTPYEDLSLNSSMADREIDTPNSMGSELMKAIKLLLINESQGGRQPITVELIADKYNLGQVVIDVINELIDDTGRIPLNI